MVVIDPIQGKVEGSHWVGADPWQMAISSDSEYLHVGLYSGWAIRRFRLSNMEPDLRIPLYTEDLFPLGRVPTRANEILAVPGQPESFVVAKAAWPGSRGDIYPQGVSVFDGQKERAKTVPAKFKDSMNTIQWADSRSALYGSPVFKELLFSPEGVEITSQTGIVGNRSGSDPMRCQYDLCFAPEGSITDARAQELLGVFSFDLNSPDFYWADAVLPDLDRGLVYFLMYSGRTPYRGNYINIEAYDARTFQRVSALKIENAETPTGSFFIWKQNQLALSTANEVILFPLSRLHNRGSRPPPTAAELRGAFHVVLPLLEQGSDRFTGFAVSNPGSGDLPLRFTAYPSFEYPEYFPSERGTLSLKTRSQWSRLGVEMFPVTGPQEAWVDLTAETPGLGAFFLLKDGDALDGAIGQTQPMRTLYFSRIITGESRFRGKTPLTEIYLVNPNGFPMDVRLTIVGAERDPAYIPARMSRPVSLEAKGLFKADVVTTLFGVSARIDYLSAYLKVEVVSPRGGIMGFETIRVPETGSMIAFNAMTPDNTGRLYSAQKAHGERIFTNLKLVNTSEESLGVSLSAVREDGSLLAGPVNVELAGGQSIQKDVAEIFNLPSNRQSAGSLKVESDGPGLIGDVLFGSPDDLAYLAALPLDNQPFTEAVFSHVANVPGFFTGIALFNASEQEASVEVQTFSSQGKETGLVKFVLKAGERLARLLPKLIPSSEGQAGGYVLVRSSQPMIGQQLFGDMQLSQLAAVPAQVVH